MRKEVLKEPTFEKEIAVMIRVSKSMDEMREQLRAYHDNDIAQSLKYLNRAERNLLYSGLDAKWLAEIMSYVTTMPVAISIPAAIGSVLFSMVIGIVFGVFPSYKAANLNPIDALRHE